MYLYFQFDDIKVSFKYYLKTEKYTKGVTSVESILMLDRLRQSVAVKELLQSAGRPLMRKTASVPNFSQVSLLHSRIILLYFCYINPFRSVVS